MIEQAMSTGTTTRLEFTDTDYIHGVEDVYKAVVYYFTEATKKDFQLVVKGLIHHYKFFCYLTSEIPIKRPDEIFITLNGITKRYKICVKKDEYITHWRMHLSLYLSCVSSLYLQWNTQSGVGDTRS